MKQLLATYLAAEETCDLLMRGRRQPRAGIRIGRHEVAQAHPHTCVLISEVVLSLALVVSLTVLSLDYWAVEHRQREAWMPLALTIRRDLPSDARIVSVTSTDPTLLNLARRQGWLISSQQLTPERLQRWKQAGASHLAGSFLWDKTYRPMPKRRQQRLREMVEASPRAWVDAGSQTYLIPIDDLQPER